MLVKEKLPQGHIYPQITQAPINYFDFLTFFRGGQTIDDNLVLRLLPTACKPTCSTPRSGRKPGTSMISKSQEETEVSLRLEEWALEAGMEMSAFSYDPMGRIAERWQTNPVNINIWVSYKYDYLGDETDRNLSGNDYASTYNLAGRLTTFTSSNYNDATNPPNLLTGVHYDAFGHIISGALANGLSESWGFDARGRVTAMAVGTGCSNGNCSTNKYRFTSGYGANSDVTSSTDTANGNWTYTYDDFNRISTGVATNGEGCSWDYDRYGNRWHQNAHNGSCPAPQFSFTGNNNRIDGYSYDALGNLLYDGVHHYSYDAESRIISVDSGATTYTYDAEGRRMTKSTGSLVTDFIYDREGHIILINPATPTLIEMYAAGLHLGTYILNSTQTDTIFYYDHGDSLGTERARTDLSGTACETIASLPFGDNQTITSTCGDLSSMHFTGKERDTESGLDNSDARYYGSSLGRLMSPDPLAGHVSDPQTLNRYAYVRNNPLNLTDPTGLDFNLTCSGADTATCHGGLQGTTTTTTNADGSTSSAFTATVISNGQNGNLVDQSGNQYNATVTGAGVSFSQAGSSQSSMGTFINGSNETTLQAGNLPGFSFTFTYSNAAGNISAGGAFTYSGTSQQAESALEGAGFHHYSSDEYDFLHPSSLTYHAVDFRSAGQPGTGAGSGHFTVKEPWMLANPFTALGPTPGDVHLGEHNNSTPGGFWPHTQEVINTFRDKLGLY
jgi:RHS repeat-associated protein